jgi:hypothetical protein
VYARPVTKAAKRKKEKDDHPDFALPEFDEGKYMRNEVEGAKAAVVTVLLAIPVAALLYGLAVWGLAIVAFFVGVALTFALPRLFGMLEVLPWPKVDTSKFERRDWLGHGSTFFFSWLAFWILLLNAPFVDLTNPAISVTAFAGTTTVAMDANLVQPVGRAPANHSVIFNITILENVAVQEATIEIQGITFPLNNTVGANYQFTYRPADGSVPLNGVVVYARDVNGHEARFSFTIQLTT